MKTPVLSMILALCLVLTGCGTEKKTDAPYEQIDAQTAQTMMEEQSGAVVLDVREPDEYDSGHIPGAVLLPLGTIDAETAQAVIPALDTTVLVYCRSGNRSKQASEKLAALGYTAVYEFGGIRDWPYEIEK